MTCKECGGTRKVVLEQWTRDGEVLAENWIRCWVCSPTPKDAIVTSPSVPLEPSALAERELPTCRLIADKPISPTAEEYREKDERASRLHAEVLEREALIEELGDALGCREPYNREMMLTTVRTLVKLIEDIGAVFSAEKPFGPELLGAVKDTDKTLDDVRVILGAKEGEDIRVVAHRVRDDADVPRKRPRR